MTAYERRISDWSSDVCSSDLAPALQRARAKVLQQHVAFRDEVADHGPPLFRAQIDGDHLLVAADAGGVERLALNAFAHAADRIALRNLDPIGRASCRGRVCQYVWISVGAVTLKKKKKK